MFYDYFQSKNTATAYKYPLKQVMQWCKFSTIIITGVIKSDLVCAYFAKKRICATEADGG